MTHIYKTVRRRALALLIVVAIAGLMAAAQAREGERGVRVVPNEAEHRVDIFVDGQPFTSYIWPTTVKKPVLYPLRTAKGHVVTRGFPLEPRPGESKDHPHQVGMWLNYGSVNGLDFWGNSDAIPARNRDKVGAIVHRKVVHATSGKDRGELEVTADWLMPNGKALLREDTKYVFRVAPDTRVIDRITTLTALDTPIAFKDDKEGMFGIRVARSLEQPSKKAEASNAAAQNNPTGLYRSSEGRTGDDVWGTRARWMMLTGKVNQEPVTLAVLDNPKNPGHPTYWHARGYGLFAANPLGQKVFSNGKETMNLTLEPKQSVTFRYRVLILSGAATPDQLEAQYNRFVAEVK